MLRRLMARFGPIHPGQTGHPMAGQTVEVQANFGGPDGGFTGNARLITATIRHRLRGAGRAGRSPLPKSLLSSRRAAQGACPG